MTKRVLLITYFSILIKSLSAQCEIDAGPNVIVCPGQSTTLGGAPTLDTGWDNPVTVSWSDGLGNELNPTVQPAQTTTYVLTVSSVLCGTVTDEVTITVLNPGSINAGFDVQYCNQPIACALTGQPFGGYWSGDPNMGANGIYVPNGEGVFTVTYTLLSTDGSCSLTDEIQITVVPPVIANAGPDFEVCESDGALSLYGSPGGGSWSCTNVVGNVLYPFTSGIFPLVYTIGSGSCYSSDVAYVTVHPAPYVNANSGTICAGESITLTAQGCDTYVWSPSSSLNSSTGSSVIASPSVTTVYTVTGTITATGCTDTEEVDVTVFPLPPTNAGPDISICLSPNPFLLSGFSPLGGTWSGTGIVGNTFTPPATGTYELSYSVTNVYGCTLADNIQAFVEESFSADAGSDVTICLNDLPLQLSAVTPGGTWLNVSLVDASAVFNAALAGEYALTYSVGDETCEATDDIIVQVLSPPAISFQAISPICLGDQIELNALIIADPLSTVTFNWTPTTDGLDFETLSPTVFPSVDTFYYLSATDDQGCSDSDSIEVIIQEVIVPFAGDDFSLCNTQAFIDAQATPIGGTWGPSDLIDPNSNVLFDTTGTFMLGYSFGYGNCLSSDSVQITLLPTPIVDIAGVTAICAGEEITLNATLDLPLDVSSSYWISADGTQTNATADLTTTLLGNSYFTFTGYATNGCFSTETALIDVWPLPQVEAGVDLSLCEFPGALTFSGFLPVTNGTGVWTGPGVVANGPQYTNPGIGTSLYYYTFTDDNGCVDYDSLWINVAEYIEADAGTDLFACENDSDLFPIDFEPTSGTWSGAIVGDPVSPQFNPDIIGPGQYAVTYSIGEGTCFSSDQMTVTINANPGISLPPILNYCEYETGLAVSALSPLGGTWSGDIISNSSSGALTPNYPSGIYTVSYTYTDAIGCSSSESMLVNVVPAPTAEFVMPDTGCTDISEFAYSISEGASDIYWETLLQEGEGDYFQFSFSYPTMYDITMIAVNEYGCRDSVTHTIEMMEHYVMPEFPDDQFTVYVPNAFTPQDGVINDYFAPIIYGKELIQTYKFQVISRWGDVLFSTESPYEVWYANVSGGDHFSKNDVFLWELVITRKDSPRKYFLQGHVLVIR